MKKASNLAQKQPLRKRAGKWIASNIYSIFYFLILGILTCYIILNWEQCISMQFFSQFNGNNILFLVWIALIILSFYDVEGKEFKVHRKGLKDVQKKIQDADSEYKQAVIADKMNMLSSQNQKNSKGGGNKK